MVAQHSLHSRAPVLPRKTTRAPKPSTPPPSYFKFKKCALCSNTFHVARGAYRRHQESCKRLQKPQRSIRSAIPVSTTPFFTARSGPVAKAQAPLELCGPVYNQSEPVSCAEGDQAIGVAGLPAPISDKPQSYIKVVHHPAARRPAEILNIGDALKHPSPTSLRDQATEPWAPFESIADFSFAEFVTKTRLSNNQIDNLLSSIRKTWTQGSVSVSFRNARALRLLTDEALDQTTKFTKYTISTTYRSVSGLEVEEEHEVHVRPIKDWICELVKDPFLISHFTWYPVRKYHYENGVKTRLIDEPASADDWWNTQDRIGKDGVVVPLILYADKTVVSSFNGRTFHPVIARIANLPDHIRNKSGHGGGTLIGYIPKIFDVEEEKDSPEFVNHKRRLYHAALSLFLSSIIDSSKFGEPVTCADDIIRLLFILVLILSADFEEQTDLALTRGLRGNFPCPICLVPNDEQDDLSATFPLRSSSESQELYHRVKTLLEKPGNKGRAEEILKSQSLRLIPNAFWKVHHSDVHHALSFDVLHYLDGGLWGNHMWSLIQKCVEDLSGAQELGTIDDRFSLVPRWPGLDHIEKVTRKSFADSKTRLSILKRILPCIHDIFQGRHKVLLQATRILACIRMHAGFRVQTRKRTDQGRALVTQFGQSIKKITKLYGKNWGFPKTHALCHLFDHIWQKGISRNYNSILGESMHVKFKAASRQTNWKELEKQVTEINLKEVAMQRIRQRIDNHEAQEATSDHTASALGNMLNPSPPMAKLSSPDRPVFVHEIEGNNSNEVVFRAFHVRLIQFITQLAELHKHTPIGVTDTAARIDADLLKITPYKLLSVPFTSLDDWTPQTDLIRCAEVFHGTQRYDTFILQPAPGGSDLAFGRLHLLFRCQAFGHSWDVALITRFDIIKEASQESIGSRRVREQRDGQFILTTEIVRAAHIVPTFGTGRTLSRDNFVNDLVDSDMYLRLM